MNNNRSNDTSKSQHLRYDDRSHTNGHSTSNIVYCLIRSGSADAKRLMLKVNDTITVPRSELQLSYSRSPGPGGQNVNKVNSKVTLRWNVRATESLPISVKQRFVARYGNRITQDGDLVLTSHRYRDQPRNVADVLDKLRHLLLAVAEPPKKRKKTKPSKASNRRRLEQKRRKSDTKRRRRNVRDSD